MSADTEGEGRQCRALAPEEVARADLYGLLARLFYAGPDAGLLASLASARGAYGDGAGSLGRAWEALVVAARATDAAAEALAYDQVFIGTGKAAVSLYASHYLTDSYKELTLVKLRGVLADLGLARRPGHDEPEDHLSGLLDVMRHLVLRGDDAATLASQQAFFAEWLAPIAGALKEAVEAAGASGFYCAAASLLLAFVLLEAEAFGIEGC